MFPLYSLADLTMEGILGRWRAGAADLNHSPNFAPFSSVSGGYQLRSAGEPSKKSGLRVVRMMWHSMDDVAQHG